MLAGLAGSSRRGGSLSNAGHLRRRAPIFRMPVLTGAPELIGRVAVPFCSLVIAHARDGWTCIAMEKTIRDRHARMDRRARMLAVLLL